MLGLSPYEGIPQSISNVPSNQPSNNIIDVRNNLPIDIKIGNIQVEAKKRKVIKTTGKLQPINTIVEGKFYRLGAIEPQFSKIIRVGDIASDWYGDTNIINIHTDLPYVYFINYLPFHIEV